MLFNIYNLFNLIYSFSCYQQKIYQINLILCNFYQIKFAIIKNYFFLLNRFIHFMI